MNPHHNRWTQRLCRALLPACLLLALDLGSAAADPIAESTLSIQVDTYRGKADALPPVQLFSGSRAESARGNAQIQRAVQGGSLLELDMASVATLLKDRPSSITLLLPTQERGTVALELFQSDIFAHDFAVSASSGADTGSLQRGLHYRGVVKGERDSFAAVSVFADEVMGTFSTRGQGNWVVGKLADAPAGARSRKHIVYAQSALTSDARKATESQCSTDPHNVDRENFATFWGEPEKPAASPAAAPVTDALQTVKCATEWLEAEYDLYQRHGSLQATMNYMTGVFNNSSTLYANDGISLRLQQIHIWDTADPYSGSNADATLASFQSNRSASFSGTIAQLLTTRMRSGVAAGFSGICNASRRASMAISGVDPTFSTVPTFSHTVQIVTHEAGHLLGSRHTHACVWNGNNTAIDSCAGRVEGSCALPGNPPGGGTVMSYCAFASVGQDFNKGFGPQPAAVIRSRVEGGGCLANCDGGGNGGGPLTRGVAMTNQAASTGSGLAYTLAVPAGATNLVFTTSGGTGDADLYVRLGSAPTTTTFDCSSDTASNTETCTIAAPAAGTYHVLLQAQAAFAGVSITGNYSTGGGGGTQTYTNTTDFAIADNSTINSPIVVSGRSGNAPANASVTVAIDHTYQGDLKVDLVAPDGTLYSIHNRTGSGTDDVRKTIPLNLSSEALNGTWNLRVNDNAANDIGTLESWSITF